MIELTNPNIVQTEQICIRAVRQYPYALKYVENQTEAICIEAVIYPYALKYVENQTEAICMRAVKKDGCVLKYVRHQTNAICIVAVKQNISALKYVRHQTDTICTEAVKQNSYALKYVRHQTEAMCMYAVKQRVDMLQYVHNQTDAVCIRALLPDTTDFCDIYNMIVYPTPQLVIRLLKIYPQYNNFIMTKYAKDLIKNYKIGSDAIVNITHHTTDILYKPNNVNALFGYARWHCTINAKTLFLII